jgi:hypothetical protein
MTDNMKIWDAVAKTNPAYTKKVSQRGGFTSVSAQYQVMQATKQFGPIGEGWGYISGALNFTETLVIVPVTIWHGSRENTFGPIYGAAEITGKRVDSDAPKKAMTDALTKGLSQLGFSADIFLGLYDDNKYVAHLEKEFADVEVPRISDAQVAELQGLLTAHNIDAVTFCKTAQIKDIPDLNAAKFGGASNWIIDNSNTQQQKAA